MPKNLCPILHRFFFWPVRQTSCLHYHPPLSNMMLDSITTHLSITSSSVEQLQFALTWSLTSHLRDVTSGSALVFQPRARRARATLAASLWVSVDKSSTTIGRGSSTCCVCFTWGLMDSRLCMHVWTSASLQRWRHTRDHAHASRQGDRMGTHTYAHNARARGRGGWGGADGCGGGHNGRMWCIVLGHGATGRGLPRANISVWHVMRPMTDGAKSWTVWK